MLHTLMQEALYSARWCRSRSLFRVTCRKCLLACTMNRAQLLLRSLKLRLRAMLGMVRARRWSYRQRPRPWREFHHCFGAGGAVSSTAGRASMARNRQVPRQSGNAIGVASEVILRETAWCHSQWHQVGSRGNLLQRASSALRTRAKSGSSWCWKGGIFRGWRIFAVHFCSAAAPEEQSRVLRIGVGWSGSTTDCGREFHHCFGAGGSAGGAVSSSAGRDACRCTGGEFNE